MRFVIVDLDGASRDYFGRREDVVEALDEVRREDQQPLEELFVVTYDDDGSEVGEPQRGDEVLASYSSAMTTTYWAAEEPVRRSGSNSTWTTRERELVGTSPAAGS